MSPRTRSLGLFALVAFGHLWAWPYQPQINNPNENVRLYMTAAIVEQHTYVIDAYRARWGWTNDAAVKDGHAYSVKAPGASELALLPYAAYYYWCRAHDAPVDRTVALFLCRAFASLLPAILFAAFFRRFLVARAHGDDALVDATVVSVSLGSLMLAYGMMFASHTQSAITAFMAFALLADARATRRATPWVAFAAGLLAAGVTWLEYPGAGASLVLSLYALVALRPKRWPLFVLGALIPTLLVMHFQWKCFGSPFTPGHRFVEDAHFREQHQHGLFGLTSFHVESLRLLVDPGFGLFPMTPLLCAAPFGTWALLRDRQTRGKALVALATIGLPLLGAFFFEHWRGGWTVGPRHIAIVVPFVGWLAFEGLLRLGRRSRDLALTFALGATLAGLLLSGIPSILYPHVPEEITRPFPQIFVPLLAGGFAPLTVLAPARIYGMASLIPLAVIPLEITARVVAGARRKLAVLVAAPLVAFVLMAPSLAHETPDPEVVPRTVEFIATHWDPPGHDRASLLRAQLAARPSAETARALVAVLRAQGREREAHAVLVQAPR